MPEQQIDLPDNLPDEPGAARAEAAGAARAYSCSNFIHQASSIFING